MNNSNTIHHFRSFHRHRQKPEIQFPFTKSKTNTPFGEGVCDHKIRPPSQLFPLKMGKAIKKSILRSRRVHTFEGSIRAINPPQDCCYQQERDRSKSDPQSRNIRNLALGTPNNVQDAETAPELLSSQREPFSESSTEPPFSVRFDRT